MLIQPYFQSETLNFELWILYYSKSELKNVLRRDCNVELFNVKKICSFSFKNSFKTKLLFINSNIHDIMDITKAIPVL